METKFEGETVNKMYMILSQLPKKQFEMSSVDICIDSGCIEKCQKNFSFCQWLLSSHNFYF